MLVKKPYWKDILVSAQYDIQVVNHFRVPKYWSYKKITPNFNRFYLILDGEGMIELNGKRYYPQPGQLYFLPADIVQSLSAISEHTFLKYWVHFTAKVRGVNLFQYLSLPTFINLENVDPWFAKFEALKKAHSSDDYTAVFKQHSILLDILASYVEQAADQVHFQMNDKMKKISAILTYIDDHLTSNLSIEQLAKIFHYHPNHLHRMFKKYTGAPPMQYINRRKMEKAKFLLLSSEQSIASISQSVGMEPYYFSRLFKAYTGYAPSVFRKIHQHFRNS